MMEQVQTIHQPRGLAICFLTEMWERYGFYVIQSLLILYMTHEFGFTDAEGYTILGTYGAFAYIAPVIGGYLADRVIGYGHAVILGAVLFVIGYGLLALPSHDFFYLGLAVAALGNGFFKPNISTYLGTMYEDRDPRREKGFTLFYVGINLGGLLAALSSGYVVRYLGWSASFAFPSLGLALGACIFIFGFRYLRASDQLTIYKKPDLAFANQRNIALLYAITLIMTFVLAECLTITFLGDLVLAVSGIGVLLTLFISAWRCVGQERNNMIICIVLMLMSVFFWALFFQAFYSINLYVDRVVDRAFMGYVLPTPMFVGLEMLFILVLGPIFGSVWQILARKQKNPTIACKFAVSFFFIALSFALLWVACQFDDGAELVGKGWIVFAYLFVTVGELLLSPTAMAAITELAPARYTGMMIGIWFVSLGFGMKFAGIMANIADVPEGVTELGATLDIYGHAFAVYAGLALVVFLVMVSLVPYVNRLISLHKKQF